MAGNYAKRSARRAALIGLLMAVIVFGGGIYYLFDTRPRSYRAEGGDLWVFERYQVSPEQKQALVDDLTQKAQHFDATGFWGLEVLSSQEGEVVLLTRWQSKEAFERFTQNNARLTPKEGLSTKYTQELLTVEARR